jgi:hypothetical protein
MREESSFFHQDFPEHVRKITVETLLFVASLEEYGKDR